jgi:acyl transferase domain-containing protein
MPGSVRSPTDLWNLILSRIIANSDRVPKSRFDIDAYLHPSNERPGSFNVSGGYFIDDDLEAFDPGLFDISHVEALCLDPQQRKLLEVVYEAFESSGTTLEDAAAQKTGCFVGSFTHDFMHMTLKEPDFRHTYNGIGIDSGMLANRISYAFHLDGPR